MALGFAVSICAATVLAQQPLPQRLYVDPGLLIGSTRVIGLGGAYAAVAEGTDGMPDNLASIGQRDAALDRPFDVDFTASFLDPVGNAQAMDFDNSGQANQSGGKTTSLLGLSFQYRRFAMGVYYRASSDSYLGGQIQTTFSRAVLAASASLDDDDLIVAAGFYAVNGGFGWNQGTWSYQGTGVELGMLYRPNGLPFRVGMSFKPEVEGAYQTQPGQAPEINGQTIYSAVVSPGIVSAGLSWRLGEGAEHYNRLSPVARREVVERAGPDHAPPQLPPHAPVGRWLLSGQLDVVLPTSNAVPVRSQINAGPEPVGYHAMLEPRFGVENETVRNRLRLRIGSYLEPSAYPGNGPRPHFTAGFELLMFHLFYEGWTVSGACDVANRYANVAVSVGWWH